jgi:outer membrane protein assembly factor BamB
MRAMKAGWAVLVLAAAVQAQTHAPATRGCAMAHCDAALSDLARTDIPATAVLLAHDPTTPGVRGGLGCSSDRQTVVCSFGGERPAINLVAYDGNGRRLWDDGGLLGPSAWLSAPLIGRDGSVVVADQDHVARLDLATGRVLWQAAKPDAGAPLSPVPLGTDSALILLATGRFGEAGPAEVSVWDRADGGLLSHGALTDPVSGRRYLTRNTPATRGTRAEAEDDPADGRLFALELCESAACGGRGQLALRWQMPFTGPSGASPLLIGDRIFHDGRDGARGSLFFAVDDLGTAPRLAWQRSFSGTFRASAARDPRGGVWIQPFDGPVLTRLGERTGQVVQTVELGKLDSSFGGYTRASVITVGTRDGNGVFLLMSARPAGGAPGAVRVLALDVGGSVPGRLLWSLPLAPTVDDNLLPAQFPVVLGPQGQRRLVVPGSRAGTFLIGEP